MPQVPVNPRRLTPYPNFKFQLWLDGAAQSPAFPSVPRSGWNCAKAATIVVAQGAGAHQLRSHYARKRSYPGSRVRTLAKLEGAFSRNLSRTRWDALAPKRGVCSPRFANDGTPSVLKAEICPTGAEPKAQACAFGQLPQTRGRNIARLLRDCP